MCCWQYCARFRGTPIIFLARRKILCKRFSTKTRISQEKLSSRLPWPLNDRLSGRLAGMRPAGGVNAGQAAVKY